MNIERTLASHCAHGCFLGVSLEEWNFEFVSIVVSLFEESLPSESVVRI